VGRRQLGGIRRGGAAGWLPVWASQAAAHGAVGPRPGPLRQRRGSSRWGHIRPFKNSEQATEDAPKA
jgi:hypothetical protein